MADRDPSDFPGNPNPPVKAPEKAKTPPAAAAPKTSAGSGALPPESESAVDATPLAKAADSSTFSVSKQENGTHDVFSMTDDGPQKLATSIWGEKDITAVMGAAGATYDKDRSVYENVPENVAKVLAEGPQSLTSEIKHRLNAGMIEFHRASLGLALADGKISAEDFRQRTHPDLVQLQLDRHPAQAWQGLGNAVSKFIEHPIDEGEDILKHSVSYMAEQLPALSDLAGKTTAGVVVGGVAAAALGPEMIPVGMKLGGAAGTFFSLYQQELGARMATLADRGLSDKDIHAHAPAEAVKSSIGAIIFMYGVEAMAAPFPARFLQSLGAETEAAKKLTEKAASWAYNYGMNAGVKMPAVGAVHQMTSDLMDNLSALVDKRPDLFKSPMDFSNNAIEAAAGMAKLGVIGGVPGAVFEAGAGMLDHRAEAKLAAEVDAKLKGVERREPLASPSQSQPRVSPSGEKTAGLSPQTASEEPLSETPQDPLESPSPSSALKSPLPDSIKEHPAYVKALEGAKEFLPEGVGVDDRAGVIDAYKQAAQEAHDFNGKAMVQLGRDELGTSALTPDEKNQISAQIDYLSEKMHKLGALARFARDPEVATVYEDWKASGAEGARPALPIDPFNEKLTTPEAAPSPADVKLEETLSDKEAKPEKVVKAAADKLGEKVQETTVKARADEVKTNLEALQQRIGEIASTRDRMQRNGLSTGALDRQIIRLVDEGVAMQKELDLIGRREPGELEVQKRAKLEVKPATLQNITDIAFKEGGKQSQERAREMLKIAEDNGLTAADVKKLVGNRSPGAMGNIAYKNFIEGFEQVEPGSGAVSEPMRVPGFREGVQKLVERKAARAEVAQVLQEKQLEREGNIRALNKLPAFSKMTTEQLKDYANILREYDKGDSALAPKRIEALKGTMLEGVKTEGEARAKAAQLTGRPVEDFKNVRVPLAARAIPDPQLRAWYPELRPFVDLAGEMHEKGERLAETVRNRNEELASEAIRERRASAGKLAKAADWLAPQQREVMAYLEAKEPAEVSAAAEKLTPAEFKWANWAKAWLGTAEDYLVKKEGMQSRFSGSYAPHVNRGWPEILRDLKDQGLMKSLKEFLPQAQGKNADFVDAQGNVLGFNKFFKQSTFRTGALEPSRNVVAALNQYISDFYRKAAQDQIFPVLDTLARSMEAKPEEGMHPKANEALTSSLLDFVKAYANNKKGINNSAGAIGEMLAPALRVSQHLAALHYIAGNYALQAIKGAVAIPVSEYMVLGNDLFKAMEIKYEPSERGRAARAILEKYESFTGKSPWQEAKAPGADVKDFASMLGYGGFGLAHKSALENILLGSMTKEEFAKGEISDARLNEIRQHAGRWINLHNSDSIMGSSAPGKAFTQYKSWAIPPTLTLAENARALARQVVGKGKMSEVQVHETMRLSALAATAALTGTIATKDMEDDSYRGQAIHYLRRALGSVWHGLDPAFFFSVAGPGYVAKLAGDLSLLVHLERQDGGGYDIPRDKEGNSKGLKALKKDLTPRLVKDVVKATSSED